jgi:hypothetical protein
MASRSAAHFRPIAFGANSYPQIGQTLLLLSISIAHDGHSFSFITLSFLTYFFHLQSEEKATFRTHTL